ncbi:hypothetical protein ACFXOT_37550, partial [Streptomyces anulatus]
MRGLVRHRERRIEATRDAQFSGMVEHGHRLSGELRPIGPHRAFGRPRGHRRQPRRHDPRNPERDSQNHRGEWRDDRDQPHRRERQHHRDRDRNQHPNNDRPEVIDIGTDAHQHVSAPHLPARHDTPTRRACPIPPPPDIGLGQRAIHRGPGGSHRPQRHIVGGQPLQVPAQPPRDTERPHRDHRDTQIEHRRHLPRPRDQPRGQRGEPEPAPQRRNSPRDRHSDPRGRQREQPPHVPNIPNEAEETPA